MATSTPNFNLKEWDLPNDLVSTVSGNQVLNMNTIDGRMRQNQVDIVNIQNQLNDIITSPAPTEQEIIQARNGYTTLLQSIQNGGINRATVDPLGIDDGYTIWVNTTNENIFVKISGSSPDVVWEKVASQSDIGNLSNLNTTDKSNIVNAINEVVDTIKIKTDIVIAFASWVDDTGTSGYWYYDITDSDITADVVVDVNIHLEDLEDAQNIQLQSANQSFAGYVRLYAKEQATVDLTADLKLIKQAGV